MGSIPIIRSIKTVTLVTVFFLLFFNSSLYLGISHYKFRFVGMFKYEKCKLCPCINCKLCDCTIQNTTIFCSINNSNLYIVLWLTGVGANSVSRVTWYTGAQGHGIQFAYTKFLLFFCLIFCLCQHQILLF